SQTLLKRIQTLNANSSVDNLLQAQIEFKKLVLAYKRVEVVYVAGYNSDSMRDIAEFYLENFIKGSKAQDIGGDLDRVFSGEASLIANSLKGITALEYTLFGDNENISTVVTKMKGIRLTSALIMIDKISGHLLEIQDYYEKTSTFSLGGEESLSALLNVLSQQSYNLRELRIGDGAGLTVKYLNKPLSTRLEYHKSLYSLESIKEILNTLKTVMEIGLTDIAALGNTSSEAEAISNAIDDALSITNSYPSTLESSLTNSRTTELYETTRIIQNNITALINGLNFTQDIIDADGD
ncbi:MAG: hypothetical protein ACI9TV_002962, partial [Sulfurimonas sp.]|uniref:imelysin family protein n=1 Tax=Sulfurimonas sp. TaxID=2022749 RepID=UPI0039E6FDED